MTQSRTVSLFGKQYFWTKRRSGQWCLVPLIDDGLKRVLK